MNGNGVIAVFFMALAVLFGLLAILILSFVIQEDNVASNLVGVVLFGGIAALAFRASRKARNKMRGQVNAVQNDQLQYRVDVVREKYFSSVTTGGKSNQLNILVFSNPEAPQGKEQVSVFREVYDGLEVGEEAYVIYLPGENKVTAIKKTYLNSYYEGELIYAFCGCERNTHRQWWTLWNEHIQRMLPRLYLL